MTDSAGPRLGVYVCHCGLNIAGVISPAALAAQAAGLPGVVVSRDHLYACSEAGQREIHKDIQQLGLDRLVVAACSPKLHEATFRRLMQESGLNPYLLEMVNIREHCAWVHAQEPKAAAAKALELIQMGLAKVRLARPLSPRQVPLVRRALVIGGGPAGLKVALDLAQGGYPVALVERQPVLGGMALHLHRTFPQGMSALRLINPLMAAAAGHPLIQVFTRSNVTQVAGHFGHFRVTVSQARPMVGPACDDCGKCAEVCPVAASTGSPPRRAIYLPSPKAFPGGYLIDQELCDGCGLCVAACPQQAIDLTASGPMEHHLEVGGMVVATGFKPYDVQTGRYVAWAALPQVITTVDMEQLLAPDGPTQGRLMPPDQPPPQDIAFILCVGSREEEGNRYCSRVCCPTALRQALELKALLPQARIRIYYRDIRTVKPEWEELYSRAREAGILFLRGQVAEVAPAPEGGALIRAYNELLGAPTLDRADLVVLAVGMTPPEVDGLRDVLKLPVGPDGFFLEAHPKLRPLETVLDGIYLAGACQGPKDLTESLTQASGAAAKLLALFAHDTITLDALVAEVDPEVCIGCETCVHECPFQAMEMLGEGKARHAQVITAACKGCGVCAGACPSGAVIPWGFTDEMILSQIDAALAHDAQHKILAFCCNWCSYAGADYAGVSRLQYPPQVRIIRTMCAGRVHPKFILHAFDRGAGQVLVSGCRPPGDCHYISGNLRAQARIEKLRPKLAKRGIDPKRLRLEWVSATEGRTFQRLITEMAAALGEVTE
jgi:heterodisulfide reductase subunit A